MLLTITMEKLTEIEKSRKLHQYKVIIRTQSAPTTEGERGLQCLRSLEELLSLRELYHLARGPLSLSWQAAHPPPTRPKPRKNIKSALLNE